MSASHATDCAERAQRIVPPTPGQMKEFWAQVQSGRIDSLRMQAILRWDIRKEWEDFYFRIFNMKADFSEVLIPEHKPGFDRVLINAHGLMISRTLDACAFPHWCYWDDPDSAITVDERSAVSGPPYAIRVRDRQEADEELKNLSAEQIFQRGIKIETALERVLHELKYFDETNEHLDINNITLCAGSCSSVGGVPIADWSGEFVLRCFGPRGSGPFLRAREVVSL
ncbi:MAG: hypothetical protein COY02_00755 [Parcubacteria group bacterium CG_4_10_14_0_2_um_filter_41_6]|nr:MAG: hypothetical protein COW93_03760 [Parcubacteria group bacterium CG22_combo_CG10-13_8_21_14_all_41_9]PIZ82063.1 MAG: hypothetical protein COY02_00755 [Parcubacteria group bacterium CG_4_10_14_0_2_um_filter_41_6]